MFYKVGLWEKGIELHSMYVDVGYATVDIAGDWYSERK